MSATTGLGRQFTCNYIFQPDGTLVAETGTRVGLQTIPGAAPTSGVGVTNVAPGGSFIGGNGNTRREGQLFQLLPQLKRYSANLIGHYDISDAIVPFIESSFVRTDSVGQGSGGPAFFTGATLGGGFERPRLDNPFLSQQAHDLIVQQMIASGVDPATITGATRFVLRKNLTDLGSRTESARRDTFRTVLGVRGDLGNNWRYEVSGNYGSFKQKTEILGNINKQRLVLALDSVKNAQGQIVCRGVADPNLGGGLDLGHNPQVLADDIAKCVPLNPFGDGSISQAAKDYVLQDTVAHGKITQFVTSGFISGDTGSFFKLPGGPVGVAIGAEYRRETASFHEDPLIEKGYTFYNAVPTFAPKAFEVKEGYAELRLLVLADMKFAHELTITGAARLADYNGAAGSVWAYDTGVNYSPIRAIQFRATYSRAVRAPNLTDLYSAVGQNFAPNFTDPCSADNLGKGTATRSANCTAAGRPASYNFQYSQSLNLLSGGNPDLKAETSNSYTYGVVIQPGFARGLALSVDYYKVQIKNLITAPTAQQIVNSCYDSPNINNQFCALVQRAGASGGPGGEEPFRIIEGTLRQVLLNYAKSVVRGVDVDLSYNHKIAGVDVSSHVIWTHAIQNEQFLDPTQPGFADRLLSELGQPKDAFNVNMNLDFGPFAISGQARYLSPMTIGVYEDTNSVQGRAPQNADDFSILKYPSIMYVDMRLGVNVTKTKTIYFGVDNITNRQPPLGTTGIGAGSGIYDNIGRRFYAGVTAKF